jgi:hypothetical protein
MRQSWHLGKPRGGTVWFIYSSSVQSIAYPKPETVGDPSKGVRLQTILSQVRDRSADSSCNCKYLCLNVSFEAAGGPIGIPDFVVLPTGGSGRAILKQHGTTRLMADAELEIQRA